MLGYRHDMLGCRHDMLGCRHDMLGCRHENSQKAEKLTKNSVNGNYDILVTHILKFGNSSGMNSQS